MDGALQPQHLPPIRGSWPVIAPPPSGLGTFYLNWSGYILGTYYLAGTTLQIPGYVLPHPLWKPLDATAQQMVARFKAMIDAGLAGTDVASYNANSFRQEAAAPARDPGVTFIP